MRRIEDIAALEAHYGTPVAASLRKVVDDLTPLYLNWIIALKLCVISTVGPHSNNASPRGDDAPVVMELDAKSVVMPDWRGNNRLDCLRDIVQDGRLSLMFLVPGSNTVVR